MIWKHCWHHKFRYAFLSQTLITRVNWILQFQPLFLSLETPSFLTLFFFWHTPTCVSCELLQLVRIFWFSIVFIFFQVWIFKVDFLEVGFDLCVWICILSSRISRREKEENGVSFDLLKDVWLGRPRGKLFFSSHFLRI